MNEHAFSPSFGFNEANGFPDVTFDIDDFNIGDIVTLLTGSPPLTVLNVCDCGTVEVAWFDGNSLSVVDLPEEALVHWDGDE